MKRLLPMVLAGLVLLLQVAVPARAASVPTVQYSKGGTVKLIMVNNPEQLTRADLGDASAGDKAIMRVTGVTGKYRNWFEHTNKTGSTIGYGVMIYNPNTTAVTVVVHGSGYTADLYGGKPFAQMLGSYSSTGTSYSVAAGKLLWIMRKDESVANGSFFSGVIDFTVSGGGVTVDNIAYDTFTALDGSRTYMGYIQRIEPDGTHEARMYKGTSAYSEATAANVNFTISDSDKGALAVSYPNYNLSTGSYGSAQVRNYWYSNIAPAQNAEAVTNDMFSWDIPGFGTINPVTQSDGEGKYPNVGNWGIIYTVKGTVTNQGTYTRSLSVNLQAPPEGGSPIAYRGNDGVWRSTKINANSNVQYYTFSVPAGGSVNYEAKYVLGGPGAGSLKNTVSVNN